MLLNSLLLMKSLNKIETPILLSVVGSLFPREIFQTFILLHCSWCKCRVASERLPAHHHNTGLYFLLWDQWTHCGIFENKFCSSVSNVPTS